MAPWTNSTLKAAQGTSDLESDYFVVCEERRGIVPDPSDDRMPVRGLTTSGNLAALALAPA